MDGRRIRNNKVAFSNLSGIVWTGPHETPIKVVSNTLRNVYFRKIDHRKALYILQQKYLFLLAIFSIRRIHFFFLGNKLNKNTEAGIAPKNTEQVKNRLKLKLNLFRIIFLIKILK